MAYIGVFFHLELLLTIIEWKYESTAALTIHNILIELDNGQFFTPDIY